MPLPFASWTRALPRGHRPGAAVARERAWAAGAAPESVTLDIDATLVDAHSEKEDAAPTYKGGFGFRPWWCFVDETNEALAGRAAAGQRLALQCRRPRRRPQSLHRSASGRLAAGHEAGRRRGAPPLVVRTDSAGASHEFVDACLARNCEVSIGLPVDERVRNALFMAQEEDWVPAIEADGTRPGGAWVTELTALIDLSGWGGTRPCGSSPAGSAPTPVPSCRCSTRAPSSATSAFSRTPMVR